MKSLSEQLKDAIGIKNRINESVILASIVCASCVAFAAGPVLNTEFMKSIGSSISGLLNGIGGMFGKFGFGGKNKSINNIKELLKKDPDDLTQKEKNIIKNVANDPKLKDEFTDNELESIDKINSGVKEISSADSKELHAILKKKPEDMTPKEKDKLKKFHSMYDLSEELSDKEFSSFEAATGISAGKTDDDTDEQTASPEQISESLTILAAKANENEKDPEKKAKMDSMIDIISASAYDEDGNLLPAEEQHKKMKEMVGEDNWENFTKDMEEMQKNVNEEELKKSLEKAKENITEEDAKKMLEDQKSRAKSAAERIQKEKKELEDIDKELEELNKDKESNKDKIKELQDKNVDLIKKSTLGKASPSVAKASIDKVGKEEGETKTDPKPEEDPKPKDETEEEKKIREIETKSFSDKIKAGAEAMNKKSEAFREKFDAQSKVNTEAFNKIQDANKEHNEKIKNLTHGTDEYKAAMDEHNKKINDIQKEQNDKTKELNDEYIKKTEAIDKEKEDKWKEIDDKASKDIDEVKKSVSKKSIEYIEKEYEYKLNKITDDFDKKEKDLTAEYDKKIKDAKSEDEIKSLKDELKQKQNKNTEEWEKESKKMTAEKHKKQDEIDDNDEHDTENDETKQGKYIVKDEEVTDSKTGKKIKVKTFTGPRGGKFYYPDGQPKKPENKVYVTDSKQYTSLRNYLFEKLY